MLWKLDRSGPKPQLESVDPFMLAYHPAKRRVILFPGAGLADKTGDHQGAEPYAGSIKYVEQTLSSARATGEPMDIYLWTYEMPYEHYGAKRGHYRMERQNISHYGRQAYRFALLPLLLAEGERLENLTPALLQERCARLTVIGHSYGSIQSQDVANAMLMELRNLGWNDTDIAATMKEIVNINVASIARTDYPQPNFTQYFFTSGNDMTAINSIRSENPDPVEHVPLLRACGYIRAADVLQRYGGHLPQAELLQELSTDILKTRIMKDGKPMPRLTTMPSGYHIRSFLPDGETRWMEERSDGTEVCRMLNAREVERTQVAVVHDYRTYLHGEHKLGDLLINVANHAVLREAGIGDGSALLMTSAATVSQHAQKYQNHVRAHISERGIA